MGLSVQTDDKPPTGVLVMTGLGNRLSMNVLKLASANRHDVDLHQHKVDSAPLPLLPFIGTHPAMVMS